VPNRKVSVSRSAGSAVSAGSSMVLVPHVGDQEAFTAIGAGSVISPVGAYAAASRLRRDITFLPISDGPILRYAPVWRSANETTLIRAFVQAASDAQDPHSAI
jgi:hypothetical protein